MCCTCCKTQLWLLESRVYDFYVRFCFSFVFVFVFGGAGRGFGFSQMFQEKEEGFDFIEYQEINKYSTGIINLCCRMRSHDHGHNVY